MEIKTKTDAAIAVSSAWRHLGAVRMLIGAADKAGAKGDGSSLIIARILDADDDHGLWIELNSKRKKWPELPEYKLMIPWSFVLAILLNPEIEQETGKVIGFSRVNSGE